MPVEAACPSCEGKFRLPDAAAGKRIKCPKCKGPLDVPPLGAPVPEVAPAAVASTPPSEGLKGPWRGAPPAPVAVEPPRPETPKPQTTAPAQAVPTQPVVATPTPAMSKPKPVEFKLPEPKAEPAKFEPPKPTEKKANFPKPPEKKQVGLEVQPTRVESNRLKPELQPPVEMWFLRGEDGESYGPVDRPTLNGWHDEGRMTADSQLLKQGTDQWQWASDLYPDLEEPEPQSTSAGPEVQPTVAAGSSIHRDELEPAAASRSSRRVARGDEVAEETDVGERLSPHSKPVAFLLALTLGMFGIHRFYLGYVGIGLAMFFTFGGLLMWSLTDALRILFGHVTDSEGLKLRD